MLVDSEDLIVTIKGTIAMNKFFACICGDLKVHTDFEMQDGNLVYLSL